MRSLSALLILGCVAAGTIKPYSWSHSQEYRYKYSSHVLSGIPELNHQYAGVRLTADVRVQPSVDSSCRLQIENPRLVSYNDILDELEYDNEIKSQGEEEAIPSSMKSWLETPFSVFHKRGVVEKIETEQGEPEFIVNLKKAISSRFQLDLSRAEASRVNAQNHVSSRGQGEIIPMFTTEEESIMGKCETEYSITRLPEALEREFEEKEQSESKACEGKEYYEVLKTKNLNKCSVKPAYQYSYGVTPKAEGSLPTHSSVTRAIICGSIEDHIIRKIVTENRILFGTTEGHDTKEKLETTSVSSLELESVENIQREIPAPSSPKEYPSLVFEFTSAEQGIPHGQHGMTSAPHMFVPKMEQTQETLIKTITEIVELAERIETLPGKDEPTLALIASRVIEKLDYNELKEVEEKLKASFDQEKYSSVVEQAFFDLISMAGTGPSIKIIKDKVLSGEILENPASWSWILSNALRSVKTPTEQILEELTELLKSEHIQRNRVIRAAYAMGLTELLNKECINPETMKSRPLYQVNGEMCNAEMPFIKTNLIPYLARKLKESARTETGSVITYIHALGNLGLEESSKELLEVVEGRITVNAHPRSVAVYKLIRSARQNPHIYRPVFLAIIENSAENPEVRMAAVTALTYCSPSTAELQKLAIRTWFEPSRKVANYIYSTLKTLSSLSGSVSEYETIKAQAQTVLSMAKPSHTLGSRNLQIVQFVESLQTAVSHKLAWTSSEESAFPRSIYAGAQLKGFGEDYDFLESVFYMQGAEYVIDRLYEVYSEIKSSGEQVPEGEIRQNRREVEEKMNKLNIREEAYERPEAHYTLKFLGLQKLWSFDEKYVTDLVRKMTTEMARYQSELQRGMSYEHLKILSLSGYEIVLPTESGLPVYLSARTPSVAYIKAEVKSEFESLAQPKVEMKLKPILKYNKLITAGVFTDITEMFYGTAVQSTTQLATPFEAETSIRNGLVYVTLKQSQEHQEEIPLVHIDIHPFTLPYSLKEERSVINAPGLKTIKSRHSEKERELSLPEEFGIDMKMRIRTEESGLDLYKVVEDMKVNGPLFSSSLPAPLTSTRRTTVTVLFNPRSSEVKEVTFSLGAGIAIKETKTSVLKTKGISKTTEEKIEKICSKYAPEDISSCTQTLKQKSTEHDNEIIRECDEVMQTKKGQQQKVRQQIQKMQAQQQKVKQTHQQQQQINTQQQQQQSQQKQQQMTEKLHGECKSERQLCKEEFNLCLKKLSEEGMPTPEAKKVCEMVYDLCKKEHKTKQSVTERIEEIEEGYAMTIVSGLTLKGQSESEERKIETYITVGEKTESGKKEESQVAIKMEVKTPSLSRPFEAEIFANGKVQRPIQRWNIEEILKEDLTSKVLVHGEFGLKGEEKKSIKASILAFRSDEQVRFTRESEEYQRCKQEETEGRLLSVSCKETRHHAASINRVHAELSIPKAVADNRIVELASEAVKVFYLPYMTQRSIERSTYGQEEVYEIEAGVDGRGKTLSVMVSGNGEEVKVENLRLGHGARGLLPICTRHTLATRVLQKLTDYNAPTSCVVEGGKVETFDGYEYGYSLNDCEHIVFSEASPRPRVAVSAKETPQQQTVIMVVDGHKYELEIKKDSRHSRGNKAVIRVNGEVKEEFVEQEQNTYDDLDTYITSYEDGVYKIHSKKYGVIVLVDGKRMEVESYQHILRNRVTGLCGDMNGERYADLKSSKQCIMASPRLSALTFMLEDGQCRGVTAEEKTELRSEQERCVRKEVYPTKVSKIFQAEVEGNHQPELKHLIQEREKEICFSKELVRSCVRSFPKEVKSKQVEFTCRSGPKAEILKKRVQAGELITELKTYPTSYTQTVYQPRQC